MVYLSAWLRRSNVLTGADSDQDSSEELAQIFKLPRTEDGYFLEDHIKLRPVDLPVPGFFVAGTAHAPKTIGESLLQARAAARTRCRADPRRRGLPRGRGARAAAAQPAQNAYLRAGRPRCDGS